MCLGVGVGGWNYLLRYNKTTLSNLIPVFSGTNLYSPLLLKDINNPINKTCIKE
jgi:hypothetical protein